MNIRLINNGSVTAVQNLEAIQIKDESIQLIFDNGPEINIDLAELTSQLVVIIEDK